MDATGGFWRSERGVRIQRARRESRKLLFMLEGTPALTKQQMKANPAYATKLQQALRDQLRAYRRHAFRGPIALFLRLETTGKNVGPIQSLAKNLLDLLGKPIHLKGADRTPLLYRDDRQVHVLSVQCRHGVKTPLMTIAAMRLSDFIADLDLAAKVEDLQQDDDESRLDDERCSEYLDDLRKYGGKPITENTDKFERARILLAEHSARPAIQEHALRLGTLRLRQLRALYSVTKNHLVSSLDAQLERWIRELGIRINLPRLPTHGGSQLFKEAVSSGVSEFVEKVGWIFAPMRTPIGLEVVIRPPAAAAAGELFDLDNVVRNYLVTPIISKLLPPSDHLYLVEFGELENESEWGKRAYEEKLALPASVKFGPARYEVFRLPPSPEHSPEGYVLVGLSRWEEGVYTRIQRAIDRNDVRI